MLSMTGYGKGEFSEGGIELVCEIKTVNNRYLDVSVKAPRVFAAYEDVIRNTVRAKLTRGHADVYVSLKDKRERPTALVTDMALAASYVAAARALKEAFPDLTDDVTLTSVLRYPDVLKQEDSQMLDEALTNALQTALNAALDRLNEMRSVEGEKLKADMLSRMSTIETLVGEISERAPAIAEEYREKLRAKVEGYLAEIFSGNGKTASIADRSNVVDENRLLAEVDEGKTAIFADRTNLVDENRLLAETAIFADRSNIDEELTRLRSHIEQFRSICEERVVGRKLDFLVQEFNREANTTCSKSNDVTITRTGLALKNEIEKVREQVQNIE